MPAMIPSVPVDITAEAPPPSFIRATLDQSLTVPALFTRAGEKATRRLVEFFAAEIRNPNTRAAYARAVTRFDRWCEEHGLSLEQLTPIHIATYIEAIGRELSKPTVKQHLAALRMLGDYLVIGQIIPSNPAGSVRGPKYVLKKGKTPVLTRDEAKSLLESMPVESVVGLRDRALIALMVYSFARIGAALAMNVEDYHQQGKRWRLRLHEKGGKDHSVPAHHKLDEYLDAYLNGGQIADDKGTPLFRRLDRRRRLTSTRLTRREALAMVKRRAIAAGLGDQVCNHSFRATGITAYLEGGGTLEHAQAIAAHESPRTTKLYDRTSDEVSAEEIERIRL
jgi:site-specific recombinase XerD